MSNVITNLEEILVVLIVVSSILLGVWVWKNGKKEKLNKWFAVMAFSVVVWIIFAYLGFSFSEEEISLIFYRINFGAVALFLMSAFYFYVIHFLNYKNSKFYKKIEKIICFSGIFLILISVFTNLVIKNIVVKGGESQIIYGVGNHFFNFYAFVVV